MNDAMTSNGCGRFRRGAPAALLGSLLVLGACSGADNETADAEAIAGDEEPRGANGGRLIVAGGLQIESMVDEGDGTPRFRVWVNREGEILMHPALLPPDAL